MGKRLQTVAEHVTDITISTATVDIQVMRIGTKQMTLAVFRQLPEMDIFDQWGDLLAPPWGWVNYDRDGHSAKPFVFSYEGVLYRYKIDLQPYDRLTVKAQVKEESCYAPPVPTGRWIIVESESQWRYSGINWTFGSEESARAHLMNRLIGVAQLKEAPQLFIGV
jgi:hypothetical protein